MDNGTRGAGRTPPATDLPDEMSLCRFWNAGTLPAGCRTTDGRRVDVIYRGEWSRGCGPDFRNALLSLGNSRALRGDVEIHVRSSMWSAHGHPGNPAYDGVILHVVWLADAGRDADPPAPTIELSRHISPTELQGLPDVRTQDGSLCSAFGSKSSASRAVQLIEAAGDARFEARCASFEGDLACEQPEQVLYAALMECMGYSENKLPFRLLAGALPYELAAGYDARRIADRLSAASGLAPEKQSRALLERGQWSLARVRPANHPLRRMRGPAGLIARAEAHGGLLEYLTRDGVGDGVSGLLDRLQVMSPEGAAYIGTDRAGDIACNAVLPFAVALGRTKNYPDTERAARELWWEFPRAAVTRIERSMRDHLAVPRGARLLSKARHQQGLLHLYKRYCAHRLCEACPLSNLAQEDQ